jgi:hypothetical protein
MKFRKEIKLIIEGEITEEITPEELFKSIKLSWRHWWESSNSWPYGKPSLDIQKGFIEKMFFEEKEISNT